MMFMEIFFNLKTLIDFYSIRVLFLHVVDQQTWYRGIQE